MRCLHRERSAAGVFWGFYMPAWVMTQGKTEGGLPTKTSRATIRTLFPLTLEVGPLSKHWRGRPRSVERPHYAAKNPSAPTTRKLEASRRTNPSCQENETTTTHNQHKNNNTTQTKTKNRHQVM